MHFSFIIDEFLHLSEEFRTFIVLFSIYIAWFCLLNILSNNTRHLASFFKVVGATYPKNFDKQKKK